MTTPKNMKNQSIARRLYVNIDPATPEPIPVRQSGAPSPAESWTWDVESSEFIRIHTVAITRRTRILVRRFHAPTLLALLTLLTFTAGCQSLTYTGPTGEHFTRRSFASQTAISSLTVETTTNGVRKVQLRGYTNDQTQALGAVTEAAVRAAIQGAK